MKLKANWHIAHDGKDFYEGDTLEVVDDQAESLIASGAARRTGARALVAQATAALTGSEAQKTGDDSGAQQQGS